MLNIQMERRGKKSTPLTKFLIGQIFGESSSSVVVVVFFNECTVRED